MNSTPPAPQSGNPRRLGIGLIFAAWLLLLGVLTLLFEDWLTARWNPNRGLSAEVGAGGVREVRLQRNASGHYVARGSINGEPVDFLLDTGATTVAVSASLARRLDLPSGAPVATRTANGTVTTYSTRLDSVALGPIRLHDVRAQITPTMGGDEVLLGMSFLGRLELLQRDAVLTLRQPPRAVRDSG